MDTVLAGSRHRGETALAKRILLLDTPGGDLAPLAETFRAAAGEGAGVERVAHSAELVKRLRSGLPYDLVVLDYDLGDGKRSGSAVLKSVRAADPDIPVAAVAEKGDVDVAAEAIDSGATDFLVRGGSLERRVSTLLGKVQNLLALVERNRVLGENNRLLREASRARHRIVGESSQIRAVVDRAERVAEIPRPVLITGERGTGKELVARAIHEASGRGARPLVVVNCAAFTDTLLEAELFGHEKGAFTGAEAVAHGKFEVAAGGTLFLDEVGNMSLPFQQKILRVVEYGTFTRVGGTRELTTDARIVAATNTDLKQRMLAGEFLSDLYDRLTFEIIHVPPLREREGDVEMIARSFLEQFMREIPALKGKRLSRSALEVLSGYPFPGNVRELKNIIERAAYRDVTNEITPEDIGMLPRPEPPEGAGGFEEKVEAYKRRLIMRALEAAGGNQTRAAGVAGLSYHQFRYYYRKYAGKAE
ncbi:MAG: sigma-54-dependent transcriptional regulator [Planctomycetota bacterium]